MALQKRPVNINFSQGVDTKTDPYQVEIGKFINLTNSVFGTTGRLTKRNGFNQLNQLPNADQTTLTTLNDSLIATGSNLYSLNATNNEWQDKGIVQPIELSTSAIVRTSTSQTSPDAVTSSSGLTCVVYQDSGSAYYHIVDSITGQQIVSRVQLASDATNARVAILSNYFIITFTATVAGTPHLRYIAVPISMPESPLTVQDIATTLSTLNAGYDIYSATNGRLYIAYSDSGSVMRVRYLSSTLVLSAAAAFSPYIATIVSVTADESGSTPVIYVSFWDSGSTNGYTLVLDQSLATILAPTSIITGVTIVSLTSIADSGSADIFYENQNTYAAPYPTGGVRSDYISTLNITQAGAVSPTSIILRSVGLASKPIHKDDVVYFMVAYGEVNQPTYFLVDTDGNIYFRLAYSNGGGYPTTQILSNISLVDGFYHAAYLFKSFLASVNKNTNITSGSQVNGIYTQTGVNTVRFSINTSGQLSSEIANTLHLTGGQLWMYDSVVPVEHGFQVWPENPAAVTSNTGPGAIAAGNYYYQFIYEWTDNKGNIHRSAPSIPLSVQVVAPNDTVTIYVPNLRLTYKTSVRIVGYRWSTAQQAYYQFTSITSPVISSPTSDYSTIVDISSDAQILGNPLLYTTGGVIENIAAPASIASALFKNRLFIIDAEDRNLLWYSKQVIETTPVEMSDLFTLFVAPTTGAQGSTGPMTALSAMDDKLIIFKENAIYYITGNGPDNTGANNDFSDAVFITAAVGCSNPQSIVLIPQGLMFQSDKGIWLLGRDLSTKYVGQDVEIYNDQIVTSAEVIPGTTQARFILSNNKTLMYDYFYNQWGIHTNRFAISGTLYQGKHTYLNSYGYIFQESDTSYLDGSVPVLMSFTTSWINLAGLQGFERFYFMYLLGTYYTPFKLNMSIAFNYNPNPLQSVIVTPDNYTPNWGGESLWGSGQNWGGGQGTGSSSDVSANVFEARVFPNQQKCESFQITLQEMFDNSIGAPAGEGLSLSGLSLIIGTKRGFRTQKASNQFG